MKQRTTKPNRPKTNQAFALSAPDASSVQVAGDFTQWEQKPVNLAKAADGVWRTSLELLPGQHHYRFLVDGHWRDDPQCAVQVPNPYGSLNAVLQVG